jgi:hypothetical protein
MEQEQASKKKKKLIVILIIVGIIIYSLYSKITNKEDEYNKLTDPTQVCPKVPTCKTVIPKGEKDWEVECKGWDFKNTLVKNSPTEWLWRQGYNTATFAKHTTPYKAISLACPKFVDPTEACPKVPTCISIDQKGERDWEVDCKGWSMKNTLNMKSPSEWGWDLGYNTATFSNYKTPLEAITAACPPFIDPIEFCKKMPATCKSVEQIDGQNWKVNCKGWLQDNTLIYDNSKYKWYWMKEGLDETKATYKTSADAMTAACPDFIEPTCNGIPTCEDVTKLDERDWQVECDGWYKPNTLYMNTSATDWRWEGMYNDATFAHYKTPFDAITSACPTFTEPTCDGISTCNYARRQGENEWEVDCQGWTAPNTLYMNSPSEWKWKGAYNPATNATYTTPSEAIIKACPILLDPTQACPEVSTCKSVVQQGEKDWEVDCKGWDVPNTLHMNSPSSWIWASGTTDVYSTPLEAITTACPVFPEPTCDGISGCEYVKQTGAQEWEVDCQGWTAPNTLHMNSPSEWRWKQYHDAATFAVYKTPSEALTSTCQ